jgi:hypothetical protein
MNNRSKAQKKAKRFSVSFSEVEFYALEGALKQMAKATHSDRLSTMHRRVQTQLTRFESAEHSRDMAEAAQ